MKLSEMRQILSERDLKLTKSLGQNFLHDQNQLRRIVDAASLQTADRVLEIGPGLGPLTDLLIARAAEVLAIEKDQRLFEILKERFAGAANLKLLCDDALDYVKQNRHWRGWKLAANLPYSVASPILVELAEAAEPPEQMTATLQIEVAQRIVATRGEENYGLLGLLLQLRYESRGWFKIPASCFFPPPDVDSACIVLVRRETRLLSDVLHPLFTKLVKRGFSQRRKMMFKLLKQDWPEEELESAFAAAGLTQTVRAEEASLEQFVEMAKRLDVYVKRR